LWKGCGSRSNCSEGGLTEQALELGRKTFGYVAMVLASTASLDSRNLSPAWDGTLTPVIEITDGGDFFL
jgi:hypothetical protein